MRVLDLSQQLPGPYATLLLASLGAHVTKVEPVQGDAARHLDAQMFERVNAGKTSLTLNLKAAADRERLHDLARTSDVFVEGFRPGVAHRLGCDYETLRGLNENIVYCSISGFGQTGPLSRQPSHDLTLQSIVGALPSDRTIDRIGVPWVDLASGTTAAFAIVAYWQAGTGTYLDIAMLDAAAAWSSVKPEAVGTPEPTYGTLETADGKSVVIALLEDAMWTRLCAALGWSDWSDAHGGQGLRAYVDRRAAAGPIRERLETSIRSLTLRQVVDLASEHDLPMGPVDVTSDPQTLGQLATRRAPGAPVWTGSVPLPAGHLSDLSPAPPLIDRDQPKR